MDLSDYSGALSAAGGGSAGLASFGISIGSGVAFGGGGVGAPLPQQASPPQPPVPQESQQESVVWQPTAPANSINDVAKA